MLSGIGTKASARAIGAALAFAAAAAKAAPTNVFLFVWGEPDEYVSQGVTATYQAAAFLPGGTYIALRDLWPAGPGNQDGAVDGLDITLRFSANYLSPEGGDYWEINIGTDKLGQNLAVGGYPQAQRTDFAAPGYAGLDVTADYRGHSECRGAFDVLALDVDYSESKPVLKTLAISFKQTPVRPDGDERWLHGTLLYSTTGALPPAIGSIGALSPSPGGGATLDLAGLAPGTTVTVECCASPGVAWQGVTSLVCRTAATSLTGVASGPATPAVDRCFYRLRTTLPGGSY